VVRNETKFNIKSLPLYLKEHPWTLHLTEVKAPWTQTLGMELGKDARNTLVLHYEKQEEKTLKRIPEFKNQYKAMLRLARNWPLGRTKHTVETEAAHRWVEKQRHLWNYSSGDYRRGPWTHKYQMVETLGGKLQLMKLREQHGIPAMSLLPLRGYGLTHVLVDTEAMIRLVTDAYKGLGVDEDDLPMTQKEWRKHKAELFQQVMDVNKLDIPNTQIKGKKRWQFKHSFRTDSVAISACFIRQYEELHPVARRSTTNKKQKVGESKEPQHEETEPDEADQVNFVDPDDASDHENEELLPVYMEHYPTGVFPDERRIRSSNTQALRLCGIDPGRTTLMEAVIQSQDVSNPHTFTHRLSKRQYYHEGGLLKATQKRQDWLATEPEVQEALKLSCQFSYKQADLHKFHECVAARQARVDPLLWRFFAVSAFCNLKFRTFRLKKKAVGRFFRRLLAPDSAQKEYELQRRQRGQQRLHSPRGKPKRKAQRRAQRQRRVQNRAKVVARTVVGYGNGNFPVAARGQAAGPLKPLRTVLARQAKVCLMDEYRTSQVHWECYEALQTKRLSGWRWRKVSSPFLDDGRSTRLRFGGVVINERERADGVREQLVERVRDPWSLRWCPTCRKFLVRDANSAVLMLHLLRDRLFGGCRPVCLSRKTVSRDLGGNGVVRAPVPSVQHT